METQAGWCAARSGKVPHVPCKSEHGAGWRQRALRTGGTETRARRSLHSIQGASADFSLNTQVASRQPSCPSLSCFLSHLLLV